MKEIVSREDDTQYGRKEEELENNPDFSSNDVLNYFDFVSFLKQGHEENTLKLESNKASLYFYLHKLIDSINSKYSNDNLNIAKVSFPKHKRPYRRNNNKILGS